MWLSILVDYGILFLVGSLLLVFEKVFGDGELYDSFCSKPPNLYQRLILNPLYRYLSFLFPNPKEFESPPGFFKRWIFIPAFRIVKTVVGLAFWIVLTVVGLALVTFVVLGILGILWSFVEPLFRDYIPREYVFMLVFLLLAILLFKEKR